jgi:hypothetical protein
MSILILLWLLFSFFFFTQSFYDLSNAESPHAIPWASSGTILLVLRWGGSPAEPTVKCKYYVLFALPQ